MIPQFLWPKAGNGSELCPHMVVLFLAYVIGSKTMENLQVPASVMGIIQVVLMITGIAVTTAMFNRRTHSRYLSQPGK